MRQRYREMRERDTSDCRVPPIVRQEAPLRLQIKENEEENTDERRREREGREYIEKARSSSGRQ